MRREHHETQERLIAAADALLDEIHADEITVPRILERAGASRSSLYYFFDDLGDLLEEVYLRRFASVTQRSILALRELSARVTTSDELFDQLTEITRVSQSQEHRGRRMERARMMARVENSARFRRRVGEVQGELTNEFAEVLRDLQDRGLVSRSISALNGATFVQAYAIGRLIDDVSDRPIDDAEWVETVSFVLRRAFRPD